MRADLHVHSRYSVARHYARAGLSDSYDAPGRIYDSARAAGMDLVTLTDLDTIEGCQRLIDERRDPADFIVGEEVEASIPGSRLKAHVCVWGITESHHAEIRRAKEDIEILAAYLRASGIACAFSHFVGDLPVDIPSSGIYWRVLGLFDAMEVRNGSQGRHYNALVWALASGEAARRPPIGFVGGSDAHTLRRVGTTWTEAECSSRDEFVDAIRSGRTAAGGRVRGASDIVLDLGALTYSHYASLPERFRRRERGLLRAAAAVPLQALGAPLVGTVVYFVRVRRQVLALQREIAALDLHDFRKRMRSYPRSALDTE